MEGAHRLFIFREENMLGEILYFLISSFPGREMKAGWSLSFVYDSYLWAFNHHCDFPVG